MNSYSIWKFDFFAWRNKNGKLLWAQTPLTAIPAKLSVQCSRVAFHFFSLFLCRQLLRTFIKCFWRRVAFIDSLLTTICSNTLYTESPYYWRVAMNAWYIHDTVAGKLASCMDGFCCPFDAVSNCRFGTEKFFFSKSRKDNKIWVEK